jgi:hypothetical protein
MIDRLVTALREAQLDLDWRDLADVLWLADVRAQAAKQESPADGAPAVFGDSAADRLGIAQPASAAPAPQAHDGPSATSTEKATQSRARSTAAEGTTPRSTAGWQLTQQDGAEDPGGVGLEAVTPARFALPGGQEIGRALRPLKQRRRTPRRRVFDPEATVDLFCDTGVLAPVLSPGSERWFDVAVVADTAATMAVWDDTVAAFADLLERHGAFRAVSRWGLRERGGEIEILTPTGFAHRPHELLDLAGRRLVLIITDAVDELWARTPVWQAVREWGKYGPVALVQLLPPRSWPQTQVGEADAAVMATRPGQPNLQLEIVPPWWWLERESPEHVVPMVGLDETSLVPWARMVMGAVGVSVPGVVVVPNIPTDIAAFVDGAAGDAGALGIMTADAGEARGEADLDQLGNVLRSTISAQAYRLAVLLSAVEVSLPIARIVMHQLMPHARLAHLAELVAAGVLRAERVPTVGGAAREAGTQVPAPGGAGRSNVELTFTPGLRNLLQRSLTVTMTLQVWRAVAPYLETTHGLPRFSLLLEQADLATEADTATEAVREDMQTIASDLAIRLGLNPVPTLTEARATKTPPQRRPAHGPQTLIIRIGALEEGRGFPVRGLSVGPGESAEAEHVAGEIPWPLPELSPGRPGSNTLADIQQVMLTPGDVTPAAVGRYLWHLLTATEVLSWWRDAAEAAGDGQVRTVLDVRAPELRTLPWELLQRTPDGWRPFLSRDNPWTRGRGVGEGADDVLVPVRMLVVIGDRDSPALQVDDELDAIFGALGEFSAQWFVEVLVNPSREAMRNVTERLQPHILHVITRGAVTAESGPVLVIPGDQQSLWELPAADVGRLLPSPAPRLVVLNTHHPGGVTHQDMAASCAFADAFLRLGCGAVVTMQGDIPSAAAVPFSAAFYREIASGQAVDVAAAQGRRAIDGVRLADQDSRSWAMPSLHTRVLPDRVLQVHLAVNPNRFNHPPYEAAYGQVRRYVDRTTERWELLRHIAPDSGQPRQPLIAVTGLPGVGKSAVVKWVLLTCQLQGQQVAYVDMASYDGQLKWLTVLRYIRDEVRRWLPQAAAAAERFDHELAFLKECQTPTEYTPESARRDDGKAFNPQSGDSKVWIGRIFASFQTLLAAATDDGPLVLVLDHLSTIYDLRDYIVPELLAPIARTEVPNVQAVLVVSEDGWRYALWEVAPTRIGVSGWPVAQIHRLGREYYARTNRLPVPQPVMQMFDAVANMENPGGLIKGDQLNNILRLVDTIAE